MELRTMLRIVSGIIALLLWIMLLVRLTRFRKELKNELMKKREVESKLMLELEKKYPILIIITVFASIFSITALLLQ